MAYYDIMVHQLFVLSIATTTTIYIVWYCLIHVLSHIYRCLAITCTRQRGPSYPPIVNVDYNYFIIGSQRPRKTLKDALKLEVKCLRLIGN